MWDGETIYIGRKSVAWNLPCSKWHNPYTVDKAELEGKTLACWCHPKNCHGDVLIRLLNEKKLNSALTE